jgi:hypothetical protein
MSNIDTSIVFDNDIDTSIAFAIGKITEAQADLATYTNILGQLYRAKEADRILKRGIDPLLDDPIESFESIEELQALEAEEELQEPRAPVPQEHLQYKQHLLARRQDQREAYAKERHANATRIQYLHNRLDELQALETKVREEQIEEDKKPAAKRHQSKQDRFSQARYQAQQWAEQRKPNPNVWTSPANQKAIKDRKERAIKQGQLANRQAQYASSKLAAFNVKENARAKQLDSIIEEFQRAQQRAETLPSKEELARLEAIEIAHHKSFDTESGEGDY